MSLNQDKVFDLLSRFNRKKDYFQRDRDRFIEIASMYWGIDYGMYPDFVVRRLIEEGRQPTQIYMMAQKLDGLRGSLLHNQLDINFVPVEGSADQASLMLQDMYYSDKDLMNWDETYDIFLRDFLIQYGVERLIVSSSEHPLGNIKFQYENPINIFPDPGWKTPFWKDLRDLDKVGFYTPDELKRIYPDMAEEIEGTRMREYFEKRGEISVQEYGVHETGMPYKELETKWGQRHRVIEHHYMEDESVYWEHNVRDGVVPFPETGKPNQSQEDLEQKKRYAEQNGLGPDDIAFIKIRRSRYKVLTGVPTLSSHLVLADDYGREQVGALPFFINGPFKMGAQYRGVGDILKDLQLNTNKYVRMMQEILDRSARGAMWVDPNIVGNDPVRMRQVETNWNRSDAKLWTEPGVLEMGKRYVQEFPSSHIPNDLMFFNNLMGQYADSQSYQTPAAEGQSEHSRESGKLYQSKYEATVVARGAIDRALEQHQRNKAEAYLRQAKITYAGVQREFSTRDGKQKFFVNYKTEEGVVNDLGKLRRHRVILTPSQQGIDVRVSQRSMLAELKQSTRDPLMAATYDEGIIDTLNMTDDKKAEAKKNIEITKELERVRKQAELMQIRQMLAQAGVQQQQGPAQPTASVTPGPAPALNDGLEGTNVVEENGELRQLERESQG